jgi:hypothetical protein
MMPENVMMPKTTASGSIIKGMYRLISGNRANSFTRLSLSAMGRKIKAHRIPGVTKSITRLAAII